jgi:hypothetical protein
MAWEPKEKEKGKKIISWLRVINEEATRLD